MIGDLDSNQVPNSITLLSNMVCPKLNFHIDINYEGVPLLFVQGKLSNLDSG